VSGFSQIDVSSRTAQLKRHEQAYQGQHATVYVDQRPAYDGRFGELVSLVFVNFMLNAVTAGFYRFWAKTRLRRYFLSRISFLNDRLIYTGTGMELFVGFLVIVGILVPFFVGFDLLGSYALGQGIIAYSAAQSAYVLSLMFLFHAAVYRAQRYRLSRINWRGIRGGQTGSAFAYAARAMGWSVAVVLTAGLAYPLMRTSLMGYRINNARFGQQEFRFVGGAGPLYGYWILPWLSVLVTITCVIALVGMIGTANLADGIEHLPAEDKSLIGATMLKWSPVLFGALGLFFFSNFWYRAKEARHFTGHTAFGDLAFESRLSGIKLFVPYLAYGLLLALVIGGAAALLVAGIQQFNLAELDSEDQTTTMLIGFGVIILLLGTGSLFKPLIVQNLLLRFYCNNLTVKGMIETEKLLQSQIQAPSRGEGLADALDIDGF
jgi:uncharacterized membrane protein YjgN (DUF898 family)